jgi:hypothetical protein
MKKAISVPIAALLILPSSESEAQNARLKVITAIISLGAGIIAGSQAARAEPKPDPKPQVPLPRNPEPIAGTVYKLGTGWPTSAQYCISYAQGLCSACDPDWIRKLCVIRPLEAVLDISKATIN